METKQIQLFLLGIFLICRRANANSCYIGTVSYACEPETVSLASGVKVSATSTCGISGEKNFLEAVTRGTDEFRNVDCNQFDTSGSLIYDPKNSVDGTSRTHWKSATIFDMNSKSADLRKDRNEMVVNLTVDLGIISEIDRISITFESPRPYSMVIYSKVSFDDEWNAVRFYSVGCMEEFQMDPWYGGVSSGQKCDQSQSGFSPQSGGTVDFSRGQTKIEARYIRLAMLRIHTPRSTSDLLRDNPMYLKSFYYAISDITVRGRCMCNGHANECDLTDPKNKVCVCQHNTDGANCQDCLRFHHNKPWKSLKLGETRFECERCDCNGRSSDCVFKNDVYQRNGFRNGGVCLKCQNSTAGQNCEKCLPEHFSTRDGKCNPCNCNKEGSSDMQCDSKGMCNCKPGITGPLCDQCLPGFYGFGSTEGCTKCECDLKGTRASRMTCNPIDGSCPCKANVEGKSCENCKYGYFDLSAENDEGCRACFCYDHSKNCSEANKILNVDNIQSDLSKIDQQYGLNIGGWRAMTLLGSQCRMVLRGTSSSSSSMTTEKSLSIDSSFSNAASDCALKSTPETFVYFEVPKQFVGNRISSYGLKLSFELKPIGSFSEVMTSYRDVIVEGFVGKKVVRVMAGLYWQRNTPLRARQWNKFEFTLTETEAWQPALSPVDFQSMLLNVNSILIRGAYGDISCDLKNVALEYATEEYSFTSAQKVASEICQCPEAYSGTHCQDCAPGYRRLNVELGQLSECVKCNCNSHASDCDPLTGDCNCEHNTIGAQCDQCKPGFFGLPSKDPSEFACEPCPCSIVSDPTTGLLRNGKCEQKREDVVCVECPQGYTGPKCDVCKRGFYQRSGKCIKCDCNGNVDESSVQSYCDQLKGKCNQCTNNTMGDHCEKCVSDHYGSASDNPSSCTPCNCLPQGSSRDYSEVGVAGRQSCSPYTGACVCRPYVVGRRCDTCVEGYYGVLSGQGCSPCDCDPHGSKSPSCDVISGQCTCLPNVVGRKCDQCASGTFGLQSISNTTTAAPPESSEVVPGFSGCEKCECDPKGIEYSEMSKDSGREMTVACDEMGNCGACRDNVTGQKCDRCVENHYKETFADFETDFYACKRCDECYDFVQKSANEIRRLADQLAKTISQIQSTPVNFSGENFEQKLYEISQLAVETLDKANLISKSTKNLTDYVDQSDLVCDDILYKLELIRSILEEMEASNESNANAMDKLKSHIQETEDYVQKLDYEVTDGEKLLLLVEETANQIRANKSALLAKLHQLESISADHKNESKRIENSTEYSQNLTAEALRLLNLVQTFESSLEAKRKIIVANLNSIDSSVGDLLKKYYEFVLMVYDLTLKVFNEVNKPVPEYNFQPYMDQAAQLNMTLLELEIGLDAENETNSDLAISSADIRAEIDSLIQTSRSLNKDLSIFLVQLYEMESGLNATVNAVTKQYYTGLERLALLKGFQNATGNDSAQSSFDEQYRRIPLIRERMEDATDKCNAASRREDQFDGQVDTVNQNAQLVLDGVVRKRDAVEDVWSKLDGMTGLILSERGQVRLMQDKIAQLDRSCDDTLPLTGAKQAQQKASDDAAEAEKKSKELRGTLADTKATVDQLKNILEDTPFLTKQEKDDFEDVLAKLGDLEGDLDIEQMEKVADAMEGKVDDLDQMVKDYETKYLQALEDVQNAEEIAGNVKVICQMITTPVS